MQNHCLCLAAKVQGSEEEKTVFPTFLFFFPHSQAFEPEEPQAKYKVFLDIIYRGALKVLKRTL